MPQKNKRDPSFIRRKSQRPSKRESERVALDLAELLYAVFVEEQEVKERQRWQNKISQ